MTEIKQKTILLVEDDAITALMETSDLEKEGYRVIYAPNGEKAIESVFKNAELIDLILMDIDLGKGIDGTDAAIEILKNHNIPVVFLSSHTEKEVVQKTEKITSYGYVVKNSGITVLDASIKMAFKLFNANTGLTIKEKQLRESEEKFRLLHEQCAYAISYYTPEGKVISFNERALEKMKVRIEDVAGKSAYDLFPREYADLCMARINHAISSNGITEYEDYIDLPCFTGWITDTYSKIFDENHNIIGIQIIFNDITEKKQAGEALNHINKSLEQQKKVLSTLNEIILIANAAEDLPSLFKDILEGSLRLLDYDAGGIYIIDDDGSYARVVYSCNLPPDFIEKVGTVSTSHDRYYELFRKGIPVFTDHYEQFSPEYSQKTGFRSLVSVPLFSKKRIIGSLNMISRRRYVISDEEKSTLNAIGRELGTIIERISAEEKSKNAVTNLLTLFNTVEEMLFILGMNGKIIRVNETAVRRLLYTHREIESMDAAFLHVPERREEAVRIFREMVAGKTDSCNIPLLAKDGKRIEVETKVTRGCWDNREVMIGVSRDVTERKRAEEKILKLLREKELILKEVHHRIKNNMITIFGLLTIQSHIHENPETKNVLTDAAGRVQSMIVLYDKLYSAESNDEVSIREYIPTLLGEIAGSFPQSETVGIVTRIDDIILNAKMLFPLGIIINELVTNSMKYAFAGRNDGVITVMACIRENRVTLTFEDNGIGIPEEVSFENSTGFGMQLVGMLVKQIDGSISIEREHGSRILIEFNAADV